MIYSSHRKNLGVHPQAPTCLYMPWVAKYVNRCIVIIVGPLLKPLEIPFKECSAYGQIDQGGGEYGGREGPFHSGNLRVSNLDGSNLSISNLVREIYIEEPHITHSD